MIKHTPCFHLTHNNWQTEWERKVDVSVLCVCLWASELRGNCDLSDYDNNKPSAFHQNSSWEINKTKTKPSVQRHSHASEVEVRSSLWRCVEQRQAATCSAMTAYESQYDNLTWLLSRGTETCKVTVYTFTVLCFVFSVNSISRVDVWCDVVLEEDVCVCAVWNCRRYLFVSLDSDALQQWNQDKMTHKVKM